MTKAIPEGLHSVTPAMTIDGCAEAIEFYKKAFGAVEIERAPDPSGKKIWHAQIRIGNSAIFVNDVFPEMGSVAGSASLWIYSGDVDAAFKRAVDAGVEVKMPLADMFWGDRMASVVDRWGNRWTLAQRTRDMTPDEMKRATEEGAAEWNKRKK
jgi:PhnB protein